MKYAKDKNLELMIEGELGYLKGESQVQEKVQISSGDYTSPEQATDFVAQTGVERLAVVFGNIHGIVTEVITTTPTPNGVGAPTEASGEEKLDIKHLKKIAMAVPETFLVLHGASGLSDDDIHSAIAAGVSNVHINTELRVAYHDSLVSELQHEPAQTTPYKFLAPSLKAMKELVKSKLKLFGSVDKI